MARRIIADKDNTTFIDGRGDESAIRTRIDLIREQIKKTTSDFDREKLGERLAKICSGVAILKVGADTEMELKERLLRVEKAVLAVDAAFEGGIVPGNGVTILNGMIELDRYKPERAYEGMGVIILRAALETYVKKLAASCGQDVNVFIANVQQMMKQTGNRNVGYDALNEAYTDMFEAGVVESGKIICQSLERDVLSAVNALISCASQQKNKLF